MPLLPDLGRFHKFLTHRGYGADGLPFIGPAGTLTPLHYDLTNNLLAQVRGRKRFIMAPPPATPFLHTNFRWDNHFADGHPE